MFKTPTETPTETADRLVSEWLNADYSNASTLHAKLKGEDKATLEAALTTLALAGVKAGMSGGVKHLA